MREADFLLIMEAVPVVTWILSEMGVPYFRWCALYSWGKYSPVTQSVSEDHHRERLHSFPLGSANGPYTQLLLWLDM